MTLHYPCEQNTACLIDRLVGLCAQGMEKRVNDIPAKVLRPLIAQHQIIVNSVRWRVVSYMVVCTSTLAMRMNWDALFCVQQAITLSVYSQPVCTTSRPCQAIYWLACQWSCASEVKVPR